jgi:hypothetical protein
MNPAAYRSGGHQNEVISECIYLPKKGNNCKEIKNNGGKNERYRTQGHYSQQAFLAVYKRGYNNSQGRHMRAAKQGHRGCGAYRKQLYPPHKQKRTVSGKDCPRSYMEDNRDPLHLRGISFILYQFFYF